MTFTYDFTTEKLIAKVRLALGDTRKDAGPRPGDLNFSDEEIEAILDDVSNDVDATVYVFLKALSNEWGKYADITVGPRKESLSDIAFHYAKRASEMGSRTGLSAKSFAIALDRVDGYSEAADADA